MFLTSDNSWSIMLVMILQLYEVLLVALSRIFMVPMWLIFVKHQLVVIEQEVVRMFYRMVQM